jgi:hypothetical protein
MHRWAAVAALLACACSSGDHPPAAGGDSGAGPGGEVCAFSCLDASPSDLPLAQQVKGIVDSCAGADCHDIGAGDMRIAPGSEFNAMIGVQSFERPDLLRVRPGDPLQSYVYLKVRCEGGIEASCMPPGGAAPGVAQTFFDWIEAGAPTM